VVKSQLPFRTSMTSEIVQSDIDLTRRMIESRRPDREIIMILGKRGIDTDRAALLIDDLRYGRKVVPHLPLGYRIIPRGFAGEDAVRVDCPGAQAISRDSIDAEPGAAAVSPAQEGAPAEPAPVSSAIAQAAQPPAQSGGKPGSGSALKWTAVALLVVALGAAVWNLWPQAGGPKPAAQRAPAISVLPRARGSVPAAPDTTGGLDLEISEEGLLLSGVRLERSNALRLVAARLGPATRTNHVPDGERKLSAYVFDATGVIIYSADGTDADSLVLDFAGGDSSMRSREPFAGAFRVLGKPVNRHAAPRDLLALKAAALEQAKAGLIQGRIAGLELAFMTAVNGLDLLVIDFK
jgi:hypothetical protein